MTDFETMPSYINSARSLSEWQEKQNLKSNAEKEQARIQKELLEELKKQAQPIEAVQQKDPTSEDKSSAKKIFIVHGRDDEVLREVKSFVLGMGLEPIILYKEPSKGKTIIEKFEELGSEACYAIALFTPDDKGGLKEEGKRVKYKERARQNVIFECGYFIGKLGRERVCALVKGDIEHPSDYSGIVYVCYKDGWQSQLRKEIEAVVGNEKIVTTTNIVLSKKKSRCPDNNERVIRLDVINNAKDGVVIKSFGVVTEKEERIPWEASDEINKVPQALGAKNCTRFYLSFRRVVNKLSKCACCYVELGDGQIIKSDYLTEEEIKWYDRKKSKRRYIKRSPWR